MSRPPVGQHRDPDTTPITSIRMTSGSRIRERHPPIIDSALQATDNDGPKALLLILDLIWNGRLRASKHGLQLRAH